MKRIILLSVFLLSLSALSCADKTPAPPAKTKPDYQFVGSVNSDKFHYPDCKAAKRIKESNLVTFKDYDDAINQHRIPCKLCKPKK